MYILLTYLISENIVNFISSQVCTWISMRRIFLPRSHPICRHVCTLRKTGFCNKSCNFAWSKGKQSRHSQYYFLAYNLTMARSLCIYAWIFLSLLYSLSTGFMMGHVCNFIRQIKLCKCLMLLDYHFFLAIMNGGMGITGIMGMGHT